jgi:putative hydroxymethylpyrimidine transport system substrate-binding protein
MTRLTAILPLVAALLLAAVFAGCSEKQEPSSGGTAADRPLDELTLVLDYFPNADHAGIYAAQAAGYYREAGLDLEIQAPPDPAAPLKLVQAGRADVAISYQPELMLARDKGVQLVSVGALVQKPLTSIIALGGSGVRRVQDLEGKRVGTSGVPYFSAYLKTILEDAGVDPDSVREINVGFNLTPAMISKRVDATLGAFWNYEGTDLKLRGRKPVIMRMEELGIPTYNELIFVTPRRFLDQDGASRVRRFIQATARGHEKLRDDPSSGVDALLEADPGLERRLQSAVVETTTPLFFPEGDRPFGWQEPAEWDAYARWMHENELLENAPDGSAALTNEFLPGEGLDPGTAGRD